VTTKIRTEITTVEAWYLRNGPAVERWLERHPPPADFVRGAWEPRRRAAWAYLEMPNPETWLGRFLLSLGA